MKLKHQLPTYCTIDHLSLDKELLTELQNCVSELTNEFKSVLEVNKGLCGVHHDLLKSVYDNFFQISLTDSEVENKNITMDECEVVNDILHKNGYRHKQSLALDGNSVLNESTYTTKTDIYHRYAHIFNKVLVKFKGKPTRMRLVKLKSGSSIAPHIDYDPSYAVRIIIPIFADSECVNMFWVKNNIESVIFEPGNAYFLNTGYKHAVMNFSKNDRYTFMISIDGTDDIQHLIK